MSTQPLIQEILAKLDTQPRGLVGPQPKGANPATEWIARSVVRLGAALPGDGVWAPVRFRGAMLDVAACAIAAIQWTDRHYPRK